jgi:hypothetical protein
MSVMTLEELKEAIEEMSFDINSRVTLLVGMTAEGKYQFVKVNDDGELVIAGD